MFPSSIGINNKTGALNVDSVGNRGLGANSGVRGAQESFDIPKMIPGEKITQHKTVYILNSTHQEAYNFTVSASTIFLLYLSSARAHLFYFVYILQITAVRKLSLNSSLQGLHLNPSLKCKSLPVSLRPKLLSVAYLHP
jgi:hypothetical protein